MASLPINLAVEALRDKGTATAVEITTVFVKAYVRGNGFYEDGEPNDDLAAVITSAAARLSANPTLNRQISQTAGPFTQNASPGVLYGFTLPELAVLHLYRRRTA